MNIADLRTIRIENKNVVMIVIGSLLLVAIITLSYYAFFSNETKPSVIVQPPAPLIGLTGKPATAVKGLGQEQTLRDPFAAPPELQPVVAAGPRGNAGGSGYPPDNVNGGAGAYAGVARESAPPLPQLSGVVSAGNLRMAVLQYGSESRSYRVHERVGPYELTAVTDDTVTLWGPSGRVVLRVGR